MKVLGKSIIVRRGETFVLSRKVFKDDGKTPFVLPLSIQNPYLVISVTSTAYNVEGRYKCNYWLNLEKYPKFESSTPILLTAEQFNSNALPAGCTATSNIYTYDKNYYMYSSDNKYVAYSFVFTKQFLEYQTRDWVESQYQYTFKLIGGQKTNDILKGMYDSIYPYRPFKPTDNLTLYNEIKKCRPDMVRNIRPSAPLANYTTEDILQRPEKLIIKQS